VCFDPYQKGSIGKTIGNGLILAYHNLEKKCTTFHSTLVNFFEFNPLDGHN
jgi:hypothetical protein